MTNKNRWWLTSSHLCWVSAPNDSCSTGRWNIRGPPALLLPFLLLGSRVTDLISESERDRVGLPACTHRLPLQTVSFQLLSAEESWDRPHCARLEAPIMFREDSEEATSCELELMQYSHSDPLLNPCFHWNVEQRGVMNCSPQIPTIWNVRLPFQTLF